MSRYQSFDPNAKVRGSITRAFIDSVQYEEIRPFLEKHGFTEVSRDEWYPLQDWLDVLSDMEEAQGGNAMMDFVSVGIKISENAVFPPEMDGAHLRDVLANFNEVHQTLNHQGDVGWFDCEEISENHLKVTFKLPYPDDFIYGGLYGEARRWLPSGTDFTVEYDEDHTHKDQGGDTTIVHITW